VDADRFMRRPVLSGLIFGALVYFVMNFIVLPLSGVPHARAALTLASRINAVLALLFCIALPISLLVRTTLQRARQSILQHGNSRFRCNW
jgi:hypothetical protein